MQTIHMKGINFVGGTALGHLLFTIQDSQGSNYLFLTAEQISFYSTVSIYGKDNTECTRQGRLHFHSGT